MVRFSELRSKLPMMGILVYAVLIAAGGFLLFTAGWYFNSDAVARMPFMTNLPLITSLSLFVSLVFIAVVCTPILIWRVRLSDGNIQGRGRFGKAISCKCEDLVALQHVKKWGLEFIAFKDQKDNEGLIPRGTANFPEFMVRLEKEAPQLEKCYDIILGKNKQKCRSN